jgi:hypothetical protein
LETHSWPDAGGILDQYPEWVQRYQLVIDKKAEIEKMEQEKQKRASKRS